MTTTSVTEDGKNITGVVFPTDIEGVTPPNGVCTFIASRDAIVSLQESDWDDNTGTGTARRVTVITGTMFAFGVEDPIDFVTALWLTGAPPVDPPA